MIGCQDDTRTIIRKRIQKHSILLRKNKGNEVDTVACLLLTLDVVLFLSDKNSGFYDNFKCPLTYNREREIAIYCFGTADISTKVLLQAFPRVSTNR